MRKESLLVGLFGIASGLSLVLGTTTVASATVAEHPGGEDSAGTTETINEAGSQNSDYSGKADSANSNRPPIVPPGGKNIEDCAMGDYWCGNPHRTWYPVWTEKGWDYQPRTPEDEKRLQEVIEEDYALSHLLARDFNPHEYRFLGRTMTPQEKSYYCGPAAVQAAIKNEGKLFPTQDEVASWLGTDYTGTGWSNKTESNPVARVMNAKTSFSYTAYPTPQGHGGRPEHVNALIIRTVEDINKGKPILSNIWKGAGYGGINAMPKNRNIYHWLEIYGYMQYGQVIHFADPAGHSTAVSWGKDAQPYSYTPASTLSILQGGRGYVA